MTRGIAIVLMLAIIFFSGCEKKYTYTAIDANVTFEEHLEKKLAENFLDYWEAYSQKNFDESYDHEIQYLRYVHSIEWYKKFFEGNQKNYKVTLLESSIDAEKATLKIKLEFETNTVIRDDIWYLVSENWYHIFKDSILPEYIK